MHALMKETYRSPFPKLNVKERNEPVASEIVYCDTSAIDDGSKCAHALTGIKTLVSDVHVMKSNNFFSMF